MIFHPARRLVAPTTEKTVPASPADVLFAGDEGAIMDRKFWASMRANDFMLVDAEKRKIAIFANQSGELVIATDEDGQSCIATICPEEFNRLDDLIHRAEKQSIEIDAELSSGYAAYEAISKAAGYR